MKKILLIAVVSALTMLSCKKDRTCTCTNTVISETSTEPGYVYTPAPPSVSIDKYTKIKKNNIYAQLCVTSENTSSYTSTQWTGTTTVNYVVTTVRKSDCTLK